MSSDSGIDLKKLQQTDPGEFVAKLEQAARYFNSEEFARLCESGRPTAKTMRLQFTF